MNRKIMVFVVGLLALGASASGLVGGSGPALPPIAQRGNVPATPTPVATATPPPPSPFAAAASVELLVPDPSAILCDGAHASMVRVFVRDYKGEAVPDGTYVNFSVFNGSPSPYYAQTFGGRASTSVVIYSDAYSLQPNVEVRTGGLETAIRVRCIPNSGCPLSPPPNASPPCGAPTPYPCTPSPGSGPMSPPCEVVPPPSPPICAPSQTSPPCAPLRLYECAPSCLRRLRACR